MELSASFRHKNERVRWMQRLTPSCYGVLKTLMSILSLLKRVFNNLIWEFCFKLQLGVQPTDAK